MEAKITTTQEEYRTAVFAARIDLVPDNALPLNTL